jgi:hypothetical protein
VVQLFLPHGLEQSLLVPLRGWVSWKWQDWSSGLVRRTVQSYRASLLSMRNQFVKLYHGVDIYRRKDIHGQRVWTSFLRRREF